jgi:pimeloyl-ACP methyl ester carboxylesterase
MRRRATVVLASVAIAAAGCGASVTPSPAEPTLTPVPVASEGPVRFMTEDGVELEGQIFGTGEKVIVLAHMRPSDMTAWFPMAQILADNGFRALAFNFRGYGASGGEGFAVDVDARAAIDYMRAQGATRVGLVGASMGGTGAIAAAARDPEVVGIVALSPPFTFEGVDAKLEANDVEAPVLFLVADGDVDENGGRYRDHAIEIGRSHPETMTLLTLTGSSHGTDLFNDHGPAVAEHILNFFAQAFA